VESVDAFAYRRTIEVEGAAGVIDVRPAPEEAALALRVRLFPMGRLIDIAERVRRLFDLGADPMTIADHLGRDPRLREALAAHEGVRVPGAWDGFELAVRAVLGQQVSVRGATTLAGRLVRMLGEPLAEPDGELTHVFPRPDTLAKANLSRLGIPRVRAAALKALARAVADGVMRFDGTQEPGEIENRLKALPGIGAWTAGYIAMRALGEPDAFPPGDLGLRRALARRAPLTPQAMEEMSKDWQPWRAYAAMLLWLHGGVAMPTKRGENAA
jgi:AraC family transcriptional regulator of adaptative response / DNA-3-methyladenine glycosylase II